jgi:hypothetical protein
MYKIAQALEDLKNYYGLKEIKNVTLNMENMEDAHITFVSNKPSMLKDMKSMSNEIRYKLSLSVMIDSIFKEEDEAERIHKLAENMDTNWDMI